MTGLHTLHLLRCHLSNRGLTAILDGCVPPPGIPRHTPMLHNLEIDATMEARLVSLKTLKLPFDPIYYDYEKRIMTLGSDDCFIGFDHVET